jgi:DNA polymerase
MPLYIDFETRSRVDLKTAGLKKYAKNSSTEVLMMSWVLGDGNTIHVWQQGEPIPDIVAAHVVSGGIVVAHNAQFELALWNYQMVKQGWPQLRIEQMRCTMAACYAMGLPGALEDAGGALGLSIHKDAEGRALMLKMCKPKPDGTWYDNEELRRRLSEYCARDCAVEREIYKRVQPLSPQEQQLWQLDQYINLRGIPFDMEALEGAITMAAEEKERLNQEMSRVTDGAVTACSAVAALKEWAADYGVMQDSLAKAEITELLSGDPLPEPVENALKLRLASSRFTSISKLKAIQQRQIEGRVSYTLQYHAATTGRWAGRGIQPHNFTRDLPEPDEVEDIMEALRTNNASALRKYGEVSTVISRSLRGFIHAAPGKKLMGGDFSAIEGRGLAWLSGEEWVLKAYREIDANPELADMYVRAYAKAYGVPVETVTKALRQVGKVMELAFGYQGGVGAFAKMSAAGKILVVPSRTEAAVLKATRLGFQLFTESEVETIKNNWRYARPATKNYWYDLERAAIDAVRMPGAVYTAGAKGRQVLFRMRGSFLWCKLPSNRVLCYPYPEIRYDAYARPTLTFKGAPDAVVWATYTGQKERGDVNTTYIVDDPRNTKQWCRISTYGGKLSENITQALCRDLLADAIRRVEAAGFKVVAHVHDEIIVEGENFDEEDRMAFEMLMCEVPEWAKDFPISAGCWMAPRYRKE